MLGTYGIDVRSDNHEGRLKFMRSIGKEVPLCQLSSLQLRLHISNAHPEQDVNAKTKESNDPSGKPRKRPCHARVCHKNTSRLIVRLTGIGGLLGRKEKAFVAPDI